MLRLTAVVILLHLVFLVACRPLSRERDSWIRLEKRLLLNMSSLCQPCLAGQFAPVNCSLLPENSTLKCTDGTCAINNSLSCTLCPPGQFQPVKHPKTRCFNCTPGTFAKGNGTIECALCTRGFYCNLTQMKAPFACLPGFICPGLGTIYPLPCPKGFSCPNAAMTVGFACPSGWYCEGGLAQPEPCPEGFYCPSLAAEPIPCNWLFQAPPSSATCAPSPAFFVVVVISGLVVIVFAIWLWLTLSKRALERAERDRSSEITNLIPKATGPTYAGL